MDWDGLVLCCEDHLGEQEKLQNLLQEPLVVVLHISPLVPRVTRVLPDCFHHGVLPEPLSTSLELLGP